MSQRERAKTILKALKKICGDDEPETLGIDALTDLRHACDVHDVDFANCDRIAGNHYREELGQLRREKSKRCTES